MRLLKWFFFNLLLFFGFSATAKTAEGNFLAFVDEPLQCLNQKKYPCAVKSLQKGFELNLGKNQIFLSYGSTLIILLDDKIDLVEGELFLNAQTDININNPKIQVKMKGEVGLIKEKTNSSLSILNLAGEVEVFPPINGLQSEVLMVGFENWYGFLDQKRNWNQGTLRPINISEFIRFIYKVKIVNEEEIKSILFDYKDKWKQNIELSSVLYSEIAKRRLASFEEKKQAQELKEEKAKKVRMGLKKLFRDKFYNP